MRVEVASGTEGGPEAALAEGSGQVVLKEAGLKMQGSLPYPVFHACVLR